MKRFASVCAVVVSLVSVVPRAAGQELITWSDIENAFAGTFAVPMGQDGDYRFGYSSGVHAQLSNGHLLVIGHPYYPVQAEIELPAVLDGRQATRVGSWVDFTGGLLPTGWSGGPAYGLGGLLEVGTRIHFTKNQWYNGAGTDWETQGYRNVQYNGGTCNPSGDAQGMWTVNHPLAHHSRVGGYMSYAPPDIRDDGYTYLAGLEGTSGAALGRWGPNLFAIDPTPGSGGDPRAVGGAVLICHPDQNRQAPDVLPSNATSAWWVANGDSIKQWWIANKVTDMEWIETGTRHGVVALVVRGLGEKWYGLPDVGDLHDPYGGGSGYHAEGWTLEVWIYDPDDLMAVYSGERDPWSLSPVEAVLLIERLPGSAQETYYSKIDAGIARVNVAMSYRDGRLILLKEGAYPASTYERTPKGYVFQLGAGLPTVTLSATDADAAEEGQDTGTFTVSRDQTSGALVVKYSVGGSAASGDYEETLSGQVTIPDGQASAPITITPVDDSEVEGAETVQLTLTADAAYTIGSPSSDTVTIADNDVLPTVTLTATDPNAAEEGQDTGTFTVSRDQTSGALVVKYSVGGSAGSGDYEETL
ncbi:MAG TPA: Calx-beta domain-containing protein, partial [Phycisphaerae bacterium]|nr:Calx-beta domain-containing protein [Phycisphaerae bacterium]